MDQSLKRIAVTGGAGQISYALLFRIASGDLLGKDQPLALHILEVPEALAALEGVRMELEDCAFPLLKGIVIGSNPRIVFRDVDYALLVGAKPRGPGMERADLLFDNARIFVEHGRALNEVAQSHVQVLVIGNPCNTNCLIAMHQAPRIPRKNFHAMTRLDQNRAQSLLARKANVPIEQVTGVTIWGNHSATQVPDFFNARINNRKIEEVIKDTAWLEKEFPTIIQKRGVAIIAARGKSSAASAAQAILDATRSSIYPTERGLWYSSAVCSDKNPYGIQDDLIFSFPCRSTGNGKEEIVAGLAINQNLEEKIRASEKELLEERELVKDMLNPQKQLR